MLSRRFPQKAMPAQIASMLCKDLRLLDNCPRRASLWPPPLPLLPDCVGRLGITSTYEAILRPASAAQDGQFRHYLGCAQCSNLRLRGCKVRVLLCRFQSP